ncbi:MAG: GTPase, partial [Planctomycetota bacterium]
LAGAPNAGKSSLLNTLLGRERSIVSEQRKTTRDVLTGTLALRHSNCVLFDCAGLIESAENILDELAQQAAVDALQKSSAVVFCIDISKNEHDKDMAIRRLIEPEVLMGVATKSDLLTERLVGECVCRLNELFGLRFIAVSARTGSGIGLLREAIDGAIMEQSLVASGSYKTVFSEEVQASSVTLTARHRQAVTEAIENVAESIHEQESGNDEIAAMTLRAACQSLSTIEQESVDEDVLERIFQRFCIGK